VAISAALPLEAAHTTSRFIVRPTLIRGTIMHQSTKFQQTEQSLAELYIQLYSPERQRTQQTNNK